MSHPPVFFKYCGANTATLVLDTTRLRWSSPLRFNDMAEFQRMPRFDPTVAEAHSLLPDAVLDAVFGISRLDEPRLGAPMRLLLQLVKQLAKSGHGRADLTALLRSERPDADERIQSVLRDLFSELNLSTARVLCVTTSFDNDVMWGTYADSHAGCVLGFRHIEELSTPLLAAKQVSYTQDAMVVGSGLDFLLYGDSQELRRRTVDAICFNKKAAWAYEAEWRALTWRAEEVGRDHGDYLFYPEELESVTLGARASVATETAVRDLIREKYASTRLYRMCATNGQLVRAPAADA